MIWHIILVIVSQFGFIFFRTLNVKYVADSSLHGAMLTGLMVNVLWITTTGYGLTALYEKDWVLGIAYLAGGQIGVYYGMRKDAITKYVLSQWLNLRVIWTDLCIRWFAKVTGPTIMIDFTGIYDVLTIEWKEHKATRNIQHLILPSDLQDSYWELQKSACLREFSDNVTSDMIDKFHNKQPNQISTYTM